MTCDFNRNLSLTGMTMMRATRLSKISVATSNAVTIFQRNTWVCQHVAYGPAALHIPGRDIARLQTRG
jgi:hypothetical protein